jgi:hypothetical protein
MPSKIKSGFKSWMLFYVAFAVALAAAGDGSAEDAPATSVSPGSYSSDLAANKVFFRLPNEPSRRDDM